MNSMESGGVSPSLPDEAAGEAAALPGEAGIPNVAQQRTSNVSWKGIVVLVLLVVSLIFASVLWVSFA
jgi:hypothetical protein